MVSGIITSAFSHGIQDPGRFLAFTVETSSTAGLLKALAWTIGGLASPTGLASNLQRAQPGPFSPGCSEALSGPLWLSRSGSPQLQTVDPDRDT
jgi:hypothetical protein